MFHNRLIKPVRARVEVLVREKRNIPEQTEINIKSNN
jgi:hypothetical protein